MVAQFSKECGVSVVELYDEVEHAGFYVNELVGYRVGIKDSGTYRIRYVEVDVSYYDEFIYLLREGIASGEDRGVSLESVEIDVIGIDGEVSREVFDRWVIEDLTYRHR